MHGRAYSEMWARRGPVVYGVTSDGKAGAKALAAGLAAIMALPLGTAGPGVEGSPEALAALAAPTPPDPLPPPRPSALWHANRLAILGRVAPDACAAQAMTALPLATEAGRPVLGSVAAECARAAGDLDVVARLGGLLGAGADWDLAHLVLAEALLGGDRPRDALARLQAVSDGPVRATLLLHAHVALARWSDVVPLLADVRVDARTRAWAASQLWLAGRRTEAMRALKPLCPALPPKDRAECEALVLGR